MTIPTTTTVIMTMQTTTNAAITTITPTLEKLMLSSDLEVESVGELMYIMLVEVAPVVILRLLDVETVVVVLVVIRVTVELAL